jgi:hypothetical protein
MVGRLADGTPYFAPLGELPYDPDEDRVQCTCAVSGFGPSAALI